MPLRRWQRFVDDVGLFLDSPFCAVAAALGWSTLKVWGVRMAAKRGHKRAVVAMAPKQTRFTRMRWLPTDQTPAREG